MRKPFINMVVGLTLVLSLLTSNAWGATPAMTVTTSGLDVTVSWSTVTGATGYALLYAPCPYTGPDSIGVIEMGSETSLSVTLWEGATYYVAIAANNATEVIGYSDIELFALSTSSTSSTSGTTVTDIDGNAYNTVTIGAQTWMKENLKVKKYRNGDTIGTTTPATKRISAETTPKYQWAYNGSESNVATYGRLYTWYAATDSRGLCPTGWHLPTDAEWTTLTNYLGGTDVAGGKMKESGTTHWYSPNTGADNSSGFTALPAGFRYDNLNGGTFIYLGTYAYWWSATEEQYTIFSWYRSVRDVYRTSVRASYDRYGGFSVRCVKD